ncbi:PPOX class F420-dependent oxidoreductase [Nocardia terpenica]|uniref:PPOX class F420-dependent enzyme n=2 Tax=Nocardia terpenica TaxID=455432 RepID=A0A291RP95_9NOCA|nr:PPOX class F420-dependent oxidoreductase [Nocardia terpenica]ATL69145.1 PPOX class F420-dependent enzyme [Nocardia terpenica]
MTIQLPTDLQKYLDEAKVFATMATVGRDGQPHLTVNWIERDGDELLYSTTVTRQQYKNLVRDPRVSVLINPPETPYVYAQIRGTATITPDPDRELPDRLSLKYTGQHYADFNPASAQDADRVIVRITPTKVTGQFS